MATIRKLTNTSNCLDPGWESETQGPFNIVRCSGSCLRSRIPWRQVLFPSSISHRLEHRQSGGEINTYDDNLSNLRSTSPPGPQGWRPDSIGQVRGYLAGIRDEGRTI